MRRIAFLTSGGDCQALNATMRAVARVLSRDRDHWYPGWIQRIDV